MTAEGSHDLRRTIAILTALDSDEAAERGGLGVVEIACRVGREKTQVSRALRALAHAGLVERDQETQLYRLGWRLFTMAVNAGQPRLRAEAPPVLRQLVGALRERVHLTVLVGEGALTLLSESPMRAVQTAGWVGRTTPLHNTSSGRALLFDHSDDEIRALLGELPTGDSVPCRAPRDVEDFLVRLRQDRQRGYALVREEFEAGLVAAAAPVRDFSGRLIAALNVSAPEYRMGRELDRAGRMATTAAGRLSKAMAGR
ncbi:IclR family transcriptional regulator [Streptomyces oceani]|uniref:IclR family transcriptional regulator n=1 Tax=Streptomyces oceani TaxID=1075402 RepID=A0A1E7JXY1_9ACTN|nr:IclR family transcriptional regulator [Streptomyces oceani]OEU96471.1 hypothetical protein AN216_20280 [Streptomyces oceani]